MSIYRVNVTKETTLAFLGSVIALIAMTLFLVFFAPKVSSALLALTFSRTGIPIFPSIIAFTVLLIILVFFMFKGVTYELDSEGLKIRRPFYERSFLYSEIESFRKVSSSEAMAKNVAFPLSSRYVLKPAGGLESFLNPDLILIETSKKTTSLWKTSVIVNPENKEQFLSELKSRAPSANKPSGE
jgi:hypothetical protein